MSDSRAVLADLRHVDDPQIARGILDGIEQRAHHFIECNEAVLV
jgi:hypothetical protein